MFISYAKYTKQLYATYSHSDSDTEEGGVDPDIQDVIYAQMFFTPQPTTNKDTKQNKTYSGEYIYFTLLFKHMCFFEQ